MSTSATYVSQSYGYWMLVAFGLAMVVLTCLFARWRDSDTAEGFLVAGRQVGWFLGGCSIAASWMWAPALFISTQIAYQKGLAGMFWFTLPNILALALFALLAPTIRKKLPAGYSLPQYIRIRLGSERVHKMYLLPYFFYQLMAVTVQLFAGGGFVSLLTGIPLVSVMPIMACIALGYTWISGLEASIVTDLVQIAIIFSVGALLLPIIWVVSGGYQSIATGFSGVEGITSMFDPGVAFSFGIVTSIGLIAGAVCDQQYWQRSFAIKEGELRKAFIFGALLFGLVPLALSVLGFIAASPANNVILPPGVDISLIGVQAVAQLLPGWATFLFVLMLLCGLSSTLDSGLSAAGALWASDVVNATSDQECRRVARMAMLGVAVVGLLVALAVVYVPHFGLKHLWWVMNTIGACVLGPTLLSLYWGGLHERGVFWGVLTAFVLGIPAFVYGNIVDSPGWIVGASVFIIATSTALCFLLSDRQMQDRGQL